MSDMSAMYERVRELERHLAEALHDFEARVAAEVEKRLAALKGDYRVAMALNEAPAAPEPSEPA